MISLFSESVAYHINSGQGGQDAQGYHEYYDEVDGNVEMKQCAVYGITQDKDIAVESNMAYESSNVAVVPMKDCPAYYGANRAAVVTEVIPAYEEVKLN